MQGKNCLNRQVNIEARVGDGTGLDTTPKEGIISINSHCGVQGTSEPSFLGYTITCVKVISVEKKPLISHSALTDCNSSLSTDVTSLCKNLG